MNDNRALGNGNRESVTWNQQFDYCRIWYSIDLDLFLSGMAERGLTDEEVKKAREAISMLASIATPKNTTRNSDGEELCREGADEERSRWRVFY